TSAPEPSGPPTEAPAPTTVPAAVPPTTGPPATTIPLPDLPTEVFALGVASGDPLPESVILWTRLLPGDPAASIGDVDVPLTWEVAIDDIVASGTVVATPEHAHAVHVDATGLEPDTHYCYRFR